MPNKDPPRSNRILGLFAFIALFAISGEARATEGGGSEYALGSGTILPGAQPTPPGFNLINYNAFYVADRLNNARGERAIPKFHLDVAVSFWKLDYTFPERIGGILFGVSMGIPVVRANVSTGSGATAFHQEKTGLGDTGFAPLVAGWEFDTPLGHLNQFARFIINPPTGFYKATDRVNLGRNYVAYNLQHGNSLFPTEDTHVGFQATYLINQKNNATNYLSGQEFDVDWSAGVDLSRDWSADLNGYFYQQVTSDYRAGTLVNGDGNKGRAIGIGPQIRLRLHPGAVTLKWQTEVGVLNRTRGNRIWLQLYHPL